MVANGVGLLSSQFRSADQVISVSVELLNVEMKGITEVVAVNSTTRSKRIQARVESLTLLGDLKLNKDSEGKYNVSVVKCRAVPLGVSGLMDEETIALGLNATAKEMIETAVCSPATLDSVSAFFSSALEVLQEIPLGRVTMDLSLTEPTRIDDNFIELTSAGVIKWAHEGKQHRLQNEIPLPPFPQSSEFSDIEIQLSQHVFTASNDLIKQLIGDNYMPVDDKIGRYVNYEGLQTVEAKLQTHFNADVNLVVWPKDQQLKLEIQEDRLMVQFFLPFSFINFLSGRKYIDGNVTYNFQVSNCSSGCDLMTLLAAINQRVEYRPLPDVGDLPEPLKADLDKAFMKLQQPSHPITIIMGIVPRDQLPTVFTQDKAIVLRIKKELNCFIFPCRQ